jgi:2-polyprenyl-3-methyl-5-hydroxy-6-metoxy-1,4-benzoquinol methylase
MSATDASTIEERLGTEGRAPCLVCGGTTFVPRFPRRAAPSPEKKQDGPYRITHSERRFVGAIERCADCGMAFLPLDYLPAVSYSDAADPYYLEQEEERIVNAHRLLELVPKGGRLLEIGCATGFLLRAARDRGFEAIGVEMSEWASGIARDEFGLDVRTGKLEDAGLESGSFDVVVLADVIEHLTDPSRTVREIHRVLEPGGRLLLLTPDAGSLMARTFGIRWWGLLDDHYFYFSRQTLRRFLEKEGFAVETLKAQGREFPLSHWIFKMTQYSEVAHRVIAGATRAVGVADKRVSVNLGDMMACVARKN